MSVDIVTPVDVIIVLALNLVMVVEIARSADNAFV